MALIAGASVIALTLSNSFAYIQPSPAVSSMTEPIPSYNYSQGIYTYHFAWITYREGDTTQDGYNVHIVDMMSLSPVEWFTSPYWFKSSNSFSYHIDRFDIDGNLLGSGDYTAVFNSYQNYYQGNLRYNLNNGSGWYFIAPEELNCYSESEPFVTFSVLPPEHNRYHSHLSEPVSDKYNRYFIIDDKLYWVSFRINGAYVLTSDIMTEQEVESYTSNGEYLGARSTSITPRYSISGLHSIILYISINSRIDIWSIEYPIVILSDSGDFKFIIRIVLSTVLIYSY